MIANMDDKNITGKQTRKGVINVVEIGDEVVSAYDDWFVGVVTGLKNKSATILLAGDDEAYVVLPVNDLMIEEKGSK